MTLYRFEDNDIIRTRIETNPQNHFFIYNSRVYYDNNRKITGSLSGENIDHTKQGAISLYEQNVDSPRLSYPFITKNAYREGFSTISTEDFNEKYVFGDRITASYPISATIKRDHYSQGEQRRKVNALRTSFNFNRPRSVHYGYSSSLGDKSEQELNLISIPKVFYGTRVEPGTVQLDFWYSGSLAGRLEDENENGELIQTAPSGSNESGSVAGVCLYEEGYLVLTGSWSLNNQAEDYLDNNTTQKPKWVHWGAGITSSFSQGIVTASSFGIDFRGKTYTQNIKMFAQAPKGQVNHSNNPTFVEKGQDKTPYTGSQTFTEPELSVKNVAPSQYKDPTASFQRDTYISKVAIYDDQKRLLGFVDMEKPIRKTEKREITVKASLDV